VIVEVVPHHVRPIISLFNRQTALALLFINKALDNFLQLLKKNKLMKVKYAIAACIFLASCDSPTTEAKIEKVEKELDTIKQETKPLLDSVGEKLERAGEKIEEGAKKAGEKIEQGAKKAGDKIEKGAKKVDRKVKEEVNHR
jgi:ElaB/YqjD/DUF883 family membrane-anchored ribosome-binding protein